MQESRLWLLSLVAALCMTILLGVHLFVMHLDTLAAYLGMRTSDPLSYTAVMARAQNPVWAVGYLLLLALALYHGLYGLRSILTEVVDSRRDRMLTWIAVTLGLVAFTFGSYVIIRSYFMGGI